MVSKTILFFCTLIVLIGLVTIISEIKWLPVVEDNQLNLTAFSGEWWVVAGVSPEEKIGRCIHYNIRTNNGSKNFTIDANIIRYNTNASILWKVQSFVSGENSFIGTWTNTIKNYTTGKFEHTIIYLSSPNYDGYAIVIVKSLNKGKKIPNFSVVLSRSKKTLSQKDFEKFKELIRNADVAADRFENVDNTCENSTHIV